MIVGIVADLLAVFAVYFLLCLFLALGVSGLLQVIGRGHE